MSTPKNNLVALHNHHDLVRNLRTITERLEAVLRYHGATDVQILTHPELAKAKEVLQRIKQ